VGGAASAIAYTLSPFAERIVTIGAPRGPRRFFDGFARYFELDGPTMHATEHRLAERYGLSLDDIDATTFAPFVRAQVLVIHDLEDREVPFEHGEVLASALPHAHLLETRGLGHRRILKDPAVIQAATQFVASPRAVPFEVQLDYELYDHDRVA
jgi:pimeloyl-ACP methyl ester carboxylesterase